MAKRTRKKGDTGKRYTDAQKQKIIAYAKKIGRGGITAALKKFGVSYIALRRWMNGTAGARKVGRPTKSPGLDNRSLKNVQSAMATLKNLKKQVSLVQKTLKQLLR